MFESQQTICRRRFFVTFSGLALMVTACSRTEQAPEPRRLLWDDLRPADYELPDLLAQLDVRTLSDDSREAQTLWQQLRQEWAKAPVVAALEGAYVRLGGFVVPLRQDGARVQEFLLVPYYGACIHTPPPPANQVVHVVLSGQGESLQTFDAVWVTGRLRIARLTHDLADAGYRIDAERIERF